MSSPLGINPQPITKKGIQEHNPQIHCIYTGKKGVVPQYLAVREKTQGSALGAIYQQALLAAGSLTLKEWLGKIGYPTGRLRDDPATFGSRTKKEINLDTIREKLAYDLYQEFGRGIFRVPKTRLSSQPVLDDYSTGDSAEYARELLRLRITESLRIMSRMIEGYQNFEQALIQEEAGFSLSFLEYLQNCHRPPARLFLEGQQVPLNGLMGLLAIGRILGDTDILGGQGDNAGFVAVRNSEGRIVAAEVYKIDPGECFNFKLEDPDRRGRLSFSKNWLVNTRAIKAKKDIGGGQVLEDERDLQIAQRNGTITIYWKELTREQKDEFLATLFNCSRYLRADEILKYLLYRDGKFNRSPVEQIPEKIAEEFQKELQAWLELQLEIYRNDLQDFKSRYPEQVLRAEYIDRWGELPLPASDAAFPIRELFTQLTLIETGSETPDKSPSSEIPERDSLLETQERMNLSSPPITLETLFDAHEKQPAPRKVLLLGRAGIGKSTLCQKIAHDWASGRLWSDRYKAIYWLPLRELNGSVEEGGFLFQEKNPVFFLAKAIAHLRLGDPQLVDSLLTQIQEHGQEILILLDGLDEASPLLTQSLEALLHHPEFRILLTSRPGVTESFHSLMDRLVENIGFSKEHVSQYAHHFFSRGEVKQEIAQARKEKFLAALQKEKNLHTVAHIPLILQMLCVQWELGAETAGFAPSLAGLYADMVEELFRWQCRKAGVDPYATSGQEKKDVLSVLGEVALQGLQQGKLIIPGRLVQAVLGNARVSEKDLLRAGLLRAMGEGLTRQYCFLHLTFQEYVIAFHITQKNAQQQKAFIVEHRCKPQFQLVLALMAGIIDTQDPSKAKLKHFFDCLHTAPGELTGFYQLSLTLRCLQLCSDSVIQDWIEEKYQVYTAFLNLLYCEEKEQDKREVFDWALSHTQYLKGSEPFVKQFIKAVCQILKGTNLIYHKTPWVLGDLCERVSDDLWHEGIEALRQAIAHPSPHVGGVAIYALGRLCEESAPERKLEAFRALCQGLQGPTRYVRSNAISRAGELCVAFFPDQQLNLIDTLDPLLKDSDEVIRSWAVESIGKVCAKAVPELWQRGIEAVRQALQDSDRGVRKKALESLGHLCFGIPDNQELEWFDVFFKALKLSYEDDQEYSAFQVLVKFSGISHAHWLRGLGAIIQGTNHVTDIPVAGLLKNHCEHVPSVKWLEGFEILYQGLDNPKYQAVYGYTSILIEPLLELCKRVPKKIWLQVIRKLFQDFLKSQNPNRQSELIKCLEECFRCAPSDQWSQGTEAILEDPDFLPEDADDEAIGIRAELSLHFLGTAPSKEFDAAFKVITDFLAHPDKHLRRKATTALWKLCERASFEQQVKGLRVLCHLLNDSSKSVRFVALEALNDLLKRAPSDFWLDEFEFLYPLFQNPEKPVPDEAIEVLGKVCKKAPSKMRTKPFATLWQVLRDSRYEPYDAIEALAQCYKNIPPEQWLEGVAALRLVEARSQGRDKDKAKEMSIKLHGRAPSTQWREAFENIKTALSDESDEIRGAAQNALVDLCKIAPPEQWLEGFKLLCRVFGLYISWRFGKLCKKAPPDQWLDTLNAFLFARENLNNPTPETLSAATYALQCFSLRSFTQHLQYTPAYLRIYLQQIGIRKSPLYLNKVSAHQYQLTCIENNREVTKLISAEELAQMKQALLADNVLSSYVTRYIDSETISFNLEPLVQWLRQKVPGTWQAKDSEEIAIENPQGDSRLLSRAVRELVNLADDLEIDLQITKGEKHVSIKGDPQNLEKLFAHLKTSSAQEKT